MTRQNEVDHLGDAMNKSQSESDWVRRLLRVKVPIIAASALVGITGQMLGWSFGTCLGAVVLSQVILVVLSLKS
jgi:hypothetical protein